MQKKDLAGRLLNIKADDGEPILDFSDLSRIAAYVAAAGLVQNWVTTLCQEKKELTLLLTFLHDVDDTIAVLNEWRDRVILLVTSGDIDSN